jgi:hypothetical protein
MGLSIRVDSKGIDKLLQWTTVLKGQLPFASSRAINDTAKQAVKDLNQSTTKYFDRPTAFTQRGYKVTSYSRKTDLTAELNLHPVQGQYLTPSIAGGVRPQRPSERRLDASPAWRPGLDASTSKASGNMSKAQLIKALKGGGPYFTVPQAQGKLLPGIYQRMAGRRVKSILLFNKLPTIPRRWPIRRVLEQSVQTNWAGLLNKRMQEALKSAR